MPAPEIAPEMLSRIMAAVQSTVDVPQLSPAQLAAILELSAKTALSAAAAAPPLPAPPLAAVNGATPAALPPPLPAAAAAQPLPPQGGAYSGTSAPSSQVAAAAATAPRAPPPPPPLARSGSKRPAEAPPAVSWGTLQVALWDKDKRRRISANDYRGDLDAYLRTHPHLELYNRQDHAYSKSRIGVPGAASSHQPPVSNQLVAGTKLELLPGRASAHGKRAEPKVVVWDTRAQAKLPPDACPTQAALCAFLRAHPYLEVYAGQQPNAARRPLRDSPPLTPKGKAGGQAGPLPFEPAKSAGASGARPSLPSLAPPSVKAVHPEASAEAL
jgi:hypothetical protein